MYKPQVPRPGRGVTADLAPAATRSHVSATPESSPRSRGVAFAFVSIDNRHAHQYGAVAELTRVGRDWTCRFAVWVSGRAISAGFAD